MLSSPQSTGARVETLSPVAGLPPHIVALFEEPAAFQRSRAGDSFVFDRRAQAVYRIDQAQTTATKIVQIGQEAGRIHEPSGFDLDPQSGAFAVADMPRGRERVQVFSSRGGVIGSFTIPGRAVARITVNGLGVSGVGAMQFTGRSVLLNEPETGGLITEYGLAGTPLRTIGRLRPTGHEADRDVHLALNSGLPLVDPLGGFYFVFQGGAPLIRKYDAEGRLLFERHIEGLELDAAIASLPQVWPRVRTGPNAELPVVAPLVRTAAVDEAGRLWIALTPSPALYVYDRLGDRVRVVELRAPGLSRPSSLFFDGGRVLVAPGCYEFATQL